MKIPDEGNAAQWVYTSSYLPDITLPGGATKDYALIIQDLTSMDCTGPSSAESS